MQGTAGPYARAVDHRQNQQSKHRHLPVGGVNSRQLKEITRESYCYGSHAASLNHQEQHPAIKESSQWMIDVAQVGVLAANVRHTVSQFRPNKRSDQRDDAAGEPCAQNQRRCVYALSNYIRIDKNARPNRTAHHQHDGVK